jgi:hypothetical protein
MGDVIYQGLGQGKQLLRERQRWIKEAYKGLDQAERYARSLNGKRMRFRDGIACNDRAQNSGPVRASVLGKLGVGSEDFA